MPPATATLCRSTAFRDTCSATRFVLAAASLIWLLNQHMPPFFGVKYRHMKLWIQLFDSKRRLLGGFVRFMSRLQLPIDSNMKWFGEGWFAGCSDRGVLFPASYWQ